MQLIYLAAPSPPYIWTVHLLFCLLLSYLLQNAHRDWSMVTSIGSFYKLLTLMVKTIYRCRHGYFHVVNNDYTHWQMYAIGGSASPTIYSQGNRFVASNDPYKKQVKYLPTLPFLCTRFCYKLSLLISRLKHKNVA